MIDIARDLGVKLVQRKITRDEIYIADEAFFTGTAAEITPIVELDFRIIGNGKRGSVTKLIQDEFMKIVMGENPKYDRYLTYVEEILCQ